MAKEKQVKSEALECQTKQIQTEGNIQPMNQQKSLYQLSEGLKKTLRTYYGTKPFIAAMNAIQLIAKNELTEDEANYIINDIGQYPYDEVEQIFALMQTEIKQIENTNETK